MKEIKAIIQPFMLDKVLDALHQINELPGCTVSTVQGYGRVLNAETEETALEPSDRVKLEIVVPDGLTERVLKTIHEKAHTGNKGDGKIFINEMGGAVAIRTGEKGEKAL